MSPRQFLPVFLLWVLPFWVASAQDADSDPGIAAASAIAGKAVVVEIGEHAFVIKEQLDYLANALEAAVDEGAAAVVLKVDCPGGFASEARRFVERLAEIELPMIAWVEGRAAGAAAYAVLAADKVYVKGEKSVIGGEVEAIDWRGAKEQLPTRLTDLRYWDVEEDLVKLLKNSAPPEVIAGLGDPSKEVRIGGKKYSDAGDVLTIDLEVGSALGIIDGQAADLAELLAAAGVQVEPSLLPAPEVVILRRDEVAESSPVSEVADPAEPEPEPEAPATGAGESDRAFGETRLESYKGKVVVIKIGDETLLRDTKFEFMQRVIKKADSEGAQAIVFDMDTPGGLLSGTKSQMLKGLQNLKVPTYTYVNPRAMSAGSMISVSTDHIYMHPPSTIGASAVVTSLGGDIEGTMYKKVISSFLAAAKEVARIKGRDYDLIRAFIEVDATYSAEVPFVSETGSLAYRPVVEVGSDELLTLTSNEAAEIIDGKPLLAEGLPRTIEAMVEMAGLEGEIVRAKPLGFESVADLLVKISGWLLLFGMAGAYIEFKAPGFGVPGFISIICFGLFFFGHQAAGFLAGYEAIGVFLLGIIFVVLEIFVFPGLLVFGALGIIMIFGSLIYAMVDPVNLGWTGKINFSNIGAALLDPATNLVVALVGAAIIILLALRYLPSTPIMRWLVLDSGLGRGTGLKFAGEAGSLVSDQGEGQVSGLVGQTGQTETDLRPAGAARIGGDRLDVVSSGDFIVSGTPVRVVAHEGSRIAVEAIEPV